MENNNGDVMWGEGGDDEIFKNRNHIAGMINEHSNGGLIGESENLF